MAKGAARRRAKEKRTPKAADARVTSADPKDKAALRRIETRMTALLARGEEMAWTLGKLVDEVARGLLHHADGFTTLGDWAEARFPQGWTTLKRYRRVATAFTRATTRRYGTSKLHLGLLYIDATPEHERPAEIPRLEIRVPTSSGKATKLVPFAKCTARDLERATQAALAKPDAYDDAAEALAKRARVVAQAAVASPKGKHLHAPLVRVHPHPEQPKKVRYDVVGIDQDDLARVARALLALARKATPKGGKRGG